MTKAKRATKAMLPERREALLTELEGRFQKNMQRHAGLTWKRVLARLEERSDKL